MGMLREHKELFWVKPTKSVVNVWLRTIADPSALNARATKRNIQTQANSNDLPLKVLRDKGDWLLIQMADLTRGWVERKQVRRVSDKQYWNQVKRFGKKLVSVNISQKNFVSILKKYPHTEYVWGGRSPQGRDCSACVQDVYWRVTEYLLPRNSKDQAQKGQAISRMQIGDIIILRGLDDEVFHIGIVADSCRAQIFHLSRLRKRPVFEALEEMQKRYKIIDVRKLLKFND